MQAPGQALIRVGRLRDQANFLPENTSLSVLQQMANYRFPSLVYFFFSQCFLVALRLPQEAIQAAILLIILKISFFLFFPPDILFFACKIILSGCCMSFGFSSEIFDDA